MFFWQSVNITLNVYKIMNQKSHYFIYIYKTYSIQYIIYTHSLSFSWYCRTIKITMQAETRKMLIIYEENAIFFKIFVGIKNCFILGYKCIEKMKKITKLVFPFYAVI